MGYYKPRFIKSLSELVNKYCKKCGDVYQGTHGSSYCPKCKKKKYEKIL